MTILHSATPLALLRGLSDHKALIFELVKRDFLGRYKGSVLGVVWSLFNPLFMLAIYTFVFSVAFKARWGIAQESKVTFAIVLFSGLIVHSLFAECINRSPRLITGHRNYVKKVVFPLEILPWMVVFSALLHFLVSFGVLLGFCLLDGVAIHSGAALIPIVLFPLFLLILGLSWIFASLGVYFRDLSQITGLATSIALFMAPVFYKIEAIPEAYRSLLLWNPITLPVIQLRNLLLWNLGVQWREWLISLMLGALICQLGFWWFQKSRRGFADVL